MHISPVIEGFVQIFDKQSGEVLLDKNNSIHFENMTLALARGLGNKANGPIFEMVFGNGASTVDGTGIVTYLAPNVSGTNAALYNETFSKVVDDTSSSNTDTSLNNIVIEHTDGKFFTDIVITCTLAFGEPAGQSAFDDAQTTEGTFVFDEIGLKTEGTPKILLTHVVFHPIQKSLNRTIEIVYTLRISIT